LPNGWSMDAVAVPRWGRGAQAPQIVASPHKINRPKIVDMPPNLAVLFDILWSIDSQKNQ